MPATISQSEIHTFVATQFPTADANTFPMLIYPPGTSITLQGRKSCGEFHGFHDETQIAGGTRVSYAVVSRCDSVPEVDVTGVELRPVGGSELVDHLQIR